MSDNHAPAIAPGLYTDEAQPRLIGGRDRESGRIVFPLPTGMQSERFDPVPLSREGTLWSWTIQRFRPKTPPYAGPDAFEPYVVGYVELAGEVIVEARIVDVADSDLRIGLPLALILIPFERDGHTVAIHAFAPQGSTRA